MNIEHAFTRALLHNVLLELRRHKPGVMPGRHGLTWTTIGRRRHYFFQYDNFHWEGRAADANEARAKAWQAFIDS